jgi:hypothetical protein
MSKEELPDSVVLIPAGALLFLVGEVEHLKTHVAFLDRKVTEIQAQQDADCERLARDIAYDRQRLAKLEQPPDPTPSQKDRGDILRALLAANAGKMLVKDARHKMRLSRSQFSQLLASLNSEIEMKPYHLDKRQRVLVLK